LDFPIEKLSPRRQAVRFGWINKPEWWRLLGVKLSFNEENSRYDHAVNFEKVVISR
jgi:hypothetical protein